jgi:RNA polymerase sigma-70 factor (ECF subfamily)
MIAYQRGDAAAFDELYRRHSSKVYGYLRQKLSAREIADEVFQATFLKLHQTRRQYDPSQPFLPWLFVIARSSWADRLRRDYREGAKREAARAEPGVAGQTEPDPEPAPAEAVRDLLAALPDEQRNLLEMRYREELSFAEIGARRGQGAAAVRQAISRLTRKLRAARPARGTKKDGSPA